MKPAKSLDVLLALAEAGTRQPYRDLLPLLELASLRQCWSTATAISAACEKEVARRKKEEQQRNQMPLPLEARNGQA